MISKKTPLQCVLQLTVFIGFFVIFSGCAHFQKPQRGVMNSTIFYSSQPPIDIKLSPDFKYLGVVEEKRGVTSSDGDSQLDLEVESYLFATAGQHKKARVVVITIKKISSMFLPDIYRNEGNVVEKGMAHINDRNYESITQVTDSYPETLEKVAQLYKVPLPACSLVKSVGRRAGFELEYLIDIRYLESLVPGYQPCSNWNQGRSLSPQHREYLQQFDRRFNSSMVIMR